MEQFVYKKFHPGSLLSILYAPFNMAPEGLKDVHAVLSYMMRKEVNQYTDSITMGEILAQCAHSIQRQYPSLACPWIAQLKDELLHQVESPKTTREERRKLINQWLKARIQNKELMSLYIVEPLHQFAYRRECE